jgi:hypothetical protein
LQLLVSSSSSSLLDGTFGEIVAALAPFATPDFGTSAIDEHAATHRRRAERGSHGGIREAACAHAT